MTKSKRGFSSNSDRPLRAFDHYRNAIIRYFRRWVLGRAVEDIAEESPLTAPAGLHDDNTLDKPLVLVYRSVGYDVGERYSTTVADIKSPTRLAASLSVEQCEVSETEFEEICVAIAKLPRKYRQAFVMKLVYQYSCAEIAAYCGVSIPTVKDHVIQGFKLVREYRRQAADPDSS